MGEQLNHLTGASPSTEGWSPTDITQLKIFIEEVRKAHHPKTGTADTPAAPAPPTQPSAHGTEI